MRLDPINKSAGDLAEWFIMSRVFGLAVSHECRPVDPPGTEMLRCRIALLEFKRHAEAPERSTSALREPRFF
ncbi:MAG TPA: hypothetical protein VGN21_04905, partial [Stellaceae bacterium]